MGGKILVLAFALVLISAGFVAADYGGSLGCNAPNAGDLYTAGTCTSSVGTVYSDACTTTMNGLPAVKKYICAGTVCQPAVHACDNGCVGGACVWAGAQPTTEQPTAYASPSPLPSPQPTYEQPAIIRTASPTIAMVDEGIPIDLNQVYLVVAGAALLITVAWFASHQTGKGKKREGNGGSKGRPRRKKG
ncbi:hypothetical protein COX86_02550 [Candidatus Micrarchaeota archaeon CG_4_10_14_0_2_um_filter_60_11]|nr:MAG: hypothetical protein AUJ16_00150 [Candidatus Micrarchaeota archaeon CG1_02_60_51]PIN95872.1 MAG: hypothetical protein COU39_03665 [Candidatus Micrarchaeota archaeon CG10_big_fil_rev_8_21_14_0_10_60_32]PIO01690.1 MAG: hypothetical protein COT58_03860 [Candidatus Micrarchaeota archaeon CG09_land_8_20_14_0_10_60_16]PIY91399.1 MAG: hypothetical protein COY71_03385 [Candidatus Micrarchaeota archaeon CG_4_10_14_0_8_um_filter_60_7]PIZ90891.1 MAG: hypothetical protein COX86_02550 [Candidatus Mi